MLLRGSQALHADIFLLFFSPVLVSPQLYPETVTALCIAGVAKLQGESAENASPTGRALLSVVCIARVQIPEKSDRQWISKGRRDEWAPQH